MTLGRLSDPPASQANKLPPSAAQRRLVAHIYEYAQRYDRRLSVDDSSSSDSRGVATDPLASFTIVDESGHCHPFVLPSVPSTTAGYSKTTSAVPLVADHVALPDVAGRVDLLSALPPEIAAFYAEPGRCLASEEEKLSRAQARAAAAQRPPPPARFLGAHTEYIKLLRDMDSRGMLTYTTQPKCVVGLFGTPKSDGRIRLIIDGRPANDLFADPPDVHLPTPDLFARLSVPAGHKLWVAKSDLSDFFYRFRIPDWMHPYFALPPVDADVIGKAADFGSGTQV
jgi:hypothetical protein